MILEYGQLLIIKMVRLHILIFIKIVNLDLSFQISLKLVNFDICNFSYSQINKQRSDLDKITILASQQNLRLLEVELGFGFNMKVVRIFVKFLSI